jgi:cysteine desulfurase
MFNLINKILNNKKNKAIYLDYASLTPIDKGVIGIMEKYSSEIYANPSSLYGYGLNAKNEIEKAKQSIAKDIKAHSDEIIFTSSGTEANNIAILGSIKALGEDIKGKNILISSIEHSSVIEIALSLKQYGIEVNIIPVDQNGIVDIDFIKEKIDKNTILVSVMMINNEIGSIQPINEIAKIIRHKRKENNTFYPYFHTDACQAPLYKEINMEKLGVDMLTLDGHKIYGPRGIGMLYKRRGIEISPIMYGGNQEQGLRPGTENLPGICGFSFALNKGINNRGVVFEKINEIKNYFIQGLNKINKEQGIEIKINGDTKLCSPHILSILIPNIDNEMFVFRLDSKGIMCSTKSACLRDENESYVMKAIGVKDTNSVIRFSFGNTTKKSDIDFVLKCIKDILLKFYK